MPVETEKVHFFSVFRFLLRLRFDILEQLVVKEVPLAVEKVQSHAFVLSDLR